MTLETGSESLECSIRAIWQRILILHPLRAASQDVQPGGDHLPDRDARFITRERERADTLGDKQRCGFAMLLFDSKGTCPDILVGREDHAVSNKEIGRAHV